MSLLSRAQEMYRELLGEEPVLTQEIAPVLQALGAAAGEVIVELPWEEVLQGRRTERHQVVLRRLMDEGTRVVFYNPAARRGVETGAPLGGTAETGPPRRAEGGGLESMPVADLARWFEEGRALALIPPSSFLN